MSHIELKTNSHNLRLHKINVIRRLAVIIQSFGLA